MSKKPDKIEILEMNQSYGKLRIKARFNYPDGTYREILWKTSPERSDDEILEILERKYKQLEPSRIQQIQDLTKQREKRLKEKLKKK